MMRIWFGTSLYHDDTVFCGHFTRQCSDMLKCTLEYHANTMVFEDSNHSIPAVLQSETITVPWYCHNTELDTFVSIVSYNTWVNLTKTCLINIYIYYSRKMH